MDTILGLYLDGSKLLSSSGNALSHNNVIGRYSDFMSQISQDAYEKDFKRWPQIPSNSSCYTSLAQISK